MPEFDGRLLAAVIEQSGDAVIFANTAGIIQVWNQAAASLFGYSAQQMAQAGMDAIIPEKLRAAHWAQRASPAT